MWPARPLLVAPFLAAALLPWLSRESPAQPDQATVRECAARMGASCDAQDFRVSYVSPEGRSCVGGFTMINFPPSPATGLWNCIVAGLWAPERDFAGYFPALERAADADEGAGAQSSGLGEQVPVPLSRKLLPATGTNSHV